MMSITNLSFKLAKVLLFSYPLLCLVSSTERLLLVCPKKMFSPFVKLQVATKL